MGNYLFERSSTEGAGDDAGSSLEDDVSGALRELDWVENFTLQSDDGDGSVVVADVHFDPDWPDTANPEYLAEVFERFGVRIIPTPSPVVGKVIAADPLRVGTVTNDDAITLFVLDD
jgi:hypothetical protein